MSKNLKVLIVDDEAELRKTLVSILSVQINDYTFQLFEAEDGEQALEAINHEHFDLILMDVRMPKIDGLEALRIIKEQNPRTFVVIMTAHSNLDDAITAIKSGAYDYLEKPVQPEKIKEIITKASETQEMLSQLTISQPIFDDDIESDFVGSSEKMREVFTLINKLSQVDSTVLIRGENGTGKELVARAIHQNSPRKHGEFIAINCAALPENLMESELFGHEKGAFTGADERKLGKFQLANKGTLFLDEIGELKPSLQAKLLRVLQDKSFTPVGGTRELKSNARIITATNRNLEKMIEDSDFREDLFYRMNVMPIFMPPLRDRIDDIEQLAQFFINKYAKEHNKPALKLQTEALELMKKYKWPGNIRELESLIERSLIVENSDMIMKESLPDYVQSAVDDQVNIDYPQTYKGPLDFDVFKSESEKEFIINALKANKGKINKTVAHANIPKNTLLRKIKKYEIDVKALSGK